MCGWLAGSRKVWPNGFKPYLRATWKERERERERGEKRETKREKGERERLIDIYERRVIKRGREKDLETLKLGEIYEIREIKGKRERERERERKREKKTARERERGRGLLTG